MKLIDKTFSANINDVQQVIFETDEELKKNFNLSLKENAIAENWVFITKVESFYEEHLEKLIELIYKTLQKVNEFNVQLSFEKKELTNKLLQIIDFADEKSESFSIERMNMRGQLIKNSNKE